MVSTRQMSTTVTSNGGSNEDGFTRFTVTTRQSSNSLSNASSSSASTRSSSNNATNKNNEDKIEGKKSTNQHRIFLLDLPMEILDKIFSYVGYKKVGQLRVVSSQMNQVCSSILNSTFSKLQTQTLNRFQTVKAKMPRRESARRNHPLACECDIIETCYMRLSLLQMTFGKHIERKHCCFFPGGILDEVYNVLNYIRSTPKLERSYKVTDELFDLSTMAMEYFKEHLEPNLPEIAYFSKDFFDLTSKSKQTYSLKPTSDMSENSSSMPSPPQSNMVLRKGIRKIKQGMKMYNNQLTVLRNELRTCKRKSSEQGKQIAEQQKLLADQQKQTLEYANRLDENDKKNEEMSRKFSTLLQELNKCKAELQYWRSKSPATQICTSCGQKLAPVAPEDFQALVKQEVKQEDVNICANAVEDSETSNNMLDTMKETRTCTEFMNPEQLDVIIKSQIKPSMGFVGDTGSGLKRHHDGTSIAANTICKISSIASGLSAAASVLNSDLNLRPHTNLTAFGTLFGSRDGVGGNGDWIGIEGSSENGVNGTLNPSTSSCTSNEFSSLNIVSSDTKKARRVQNKGSRCHNVSKRSK